MAAVVAAAAVATTIYSIANSAKDKQEALMEEQQAQYENARNARITANYNAARQQTVASKKLGAIDADLAASGVDTNYGTSLAIIGESYKNAELDRMNIMWGGKISEMNAISRASAADSASGRAGTAAGISAFATLTSGAAGLMDKYGGSSKNKDNSTMLDDEE